MRNESVDGLGSLVMGDDKGIRHRQIGNARLNLAERYLSGEIGFHLHFEVFNAEEYCIFFQRAEIRDDFSMCDETGKARIGTPDSPTAADRHDGHVDMTVFVDVAELVKSPETFPISSVVRLQALYDCFNPGRDTFEQGLHPILELCRVNEDREGIPTTGGITIGKNQLPDKVVKAGTQVIGKLANFDTPFNRSVRSFASEYPDLLSGVGMNLVGNELSIGFAEGLDISFQRFQYLFSTLNLGVNTDCSHDLCNLPK